MVIDPKLRLSDPNGELTEDELKWALNYGASPFRRCHIEPTRINRFPCKTFVHGRIGDKRYLVYVRVTHEENEEQGTGPIPLCLLDAAREMNAEPRVVRLNIEYSTHYVNLSTCGIDALVAELKTSREAWNRILLKGKTIEDYYRICRKKISLLGLNVSLATGYDGKQLLSVDFTIDHVKLSTGTIDLWALIGSCGISDEYWMLTCSCGEPGCAGIELPFTVVHDKGLTLWRGYYLRPRKVFLFETKQYREEIIGKMKEFIARYKRDNLGTGLGVYFSEEGISTLENALWNVEGEKTEVVDINDTEKLSFRHGFKWPKADGVA
ncbi:MAG: hypothetical protein HQL22_08440 [Candidatus Omnitrophica bacterium]|nr:hypothetical protein [Candidatus Omnitrophota bacterium]